MPEVVAREITQDHRAAAANYSRAGAQQAGDVGHLAPACYFLRERFLGGSNKFFCLRAMFAYGDYASMHVCDEVGLAPIFLALPVHAMRLIRACVFAIRSALASVLAALIYVFVLAVVGPLGAGLALLIDVWAQLRNGHYLTASVSVLGAVWYLGWGSLLFPVLGIAWLLSLLRVSSFWYVRPFV